MRARPRPVSPAAPPRLRAPALVWSIAGGDWIRSSSSWGRVRHTTERYLGCAAEDPMRRQRPDGHQPDAGDCLRGRRGGSALARGSLRNRPGTQSGATQAWLSKAAYHHGRDRHRAEVPVRSRSCTSAAPRAIDLIAVAVSTISHPAKFLTACTDGRQPTEAVRAIDGVEVDAGLPRCTVMLPF